MTKKGRRKQRRDQGQLRSRRSDDPELKPPRSDGDPTTLYRTDPLRGDKLAHVVARLLRHNWPPRKIAKILGLSVDRVQEIKRLLEHGEG